MIGQGLRARIRKMLGRTATAGATTNGATNGAAAGGYAGDFTGRAVLSYVPVDDGHPDPGEIVWAWVPFEEDHAQGKDRPVLVIARDRTRLLGLMLTSKDHARDVDREAARGRFWFDLGSGAWDREGRPSEVRLDRILRLDPAAVRREGAVLDRARYEQVAAQVRRVKRW
jgi:mRNA-degrading endonuclease toxin of MazEF toxin-antitoxin module